MWALVACFYWDKGISLLELCITYLLHLFISLRVVMDFKDITSIGDLVTKWVGIYLNKTSDRKDKEDKALRSIMFSLFETTTYMREVLDSKDIIDYEKEKKLGLMWFETSVLVRPYNPDLAERCFFKGLYWGDHSRFTEKELTDKRIKLNSIEEDISRAIKAIN